MFGLFVWFVWLWWVLIGCGGLWWVVVGYLEGFKLLLGEESLLPVESGSSRHELKETKKDGKQTEQSI